MFTLEFLKNIKRDDLLSTNVRNDIVYQLRLFEGDDMAANDIVIIDTIDNIEKHIGLLSCLEYENKKELIPDTIDILEEEVGQLIRLIENYYKP